MSNDVIGKIWDVIIAALIVALAYLCVDFNYRITHLESRPVTIQADRVIQAAPSDTFPAELHDDLYRAVSEGREVMCFKRDGKWTLAIVKGGAVEMRTE